MTTAPQSRIPPARDAEHAPATPRSLETPGPHAGPSFIAVIAAFAAVYVIWGSTYLAIRVAVQTLPPLSMAGVRFVIAGGLMYAWQRRRSVPAPTRKQWGAAIVVGGLLLLGGNGCLSVAETFIDSGVAALLVATVPLFMVLIEGLRPRGTRPNVADGIGLIAGFAGVWVLVAPGSGAGAGVATPLGAVLVLFGSLAWSIGSLYSRHAPLPASPLMATAVEMLSGGALLLVAGAAKGEWFQVRPAGLSAASLLALAYLIGFGSLIAFSAYMWLLRVSTPARVGTYAYVNPIVAVFLGWWLLAEQVPARTLIAMLLIVAAVVTITRYGRRAAKPSQKSG